MSSSKNSAPATGRAISDREFEVLLRRTAEYCKIRRALMLKKVQPIRKTPLSAA
jgi:hypothetical protein